MPTRLRPFLAAASLFAGVLAPTHAEDTPPPAAGPAATALAAAAPAAATTSLSLDECVRRALEHGFDLEIQRYNPAMARDSVDIARGSFIPTLSLNASESRSNNAPIANAPGIRGDDRSARLGVTELLQTGTSVSVTTDLLRTENNPGSINSLYNPAYTSDFSVSVSQPLLRGAGTAITTAALNRARIGLDRAHFDFRAQALNIIQRVEGAYYNLVYAREQLKVFQLSLDLAQKLLDEAQVRKTTGVATDIDVLQAQVGVATARRNVLQAGQATQDNADALLAVIGRFELDAPLGVVSFENFNGQLPVIESSYQLALRNQPDYISAKMQLDQLKLDLDVAKNGLKPTLDLTGALGFNASRGNASDAFSGTANRDNNSWQVGLAVTYPWGRVSDKGRYRQSLALLSQQSLTLRQLEQSILVEVRAAVRAVETNAENVKIAGVAAEFSAKQYDLERARFDAGLATSREVLQTQSDLETSRVAELQARITLQNSISALHRLEGSSLERYQITLPD